MIQIFRGEPDYIIEVEGSQYQTSSFSFDELFQAADPAAWLEEQLPLFRHMGAAVEVDGQAWLPPIESQEIWAAGVTYYRSRSARMEEAEAAGGDVFYDKVYDAERPELFVKATPARARGHLDKIRIRQDSTWDVPEPELTLAINSAGKVFGFTVGNDVSSRSIEGENPLYLPQAKVYRGSCAIGPSLVVCDSLDPGTNIRLVIERGGEVGFEGSTDIKQIKRRFEELAEFLFRENEFPDGALLMTGTGIVPDNEFTLQSGDVVKITIDGLGTLENEVE